VLHLRATQAALSEDEKGQEKRVLEDKQEQRHDTLAETSNFLRRLGGMGEKSRRYPESQPRMLGHSLLFPACLWQVSFVFHVLNISQQF